MPSKTATNRVESKFNVTTDFPHLGLHSAAANGNIGLVQYALSHGQPINSVLDGVLPLHAACSGGNDLVVKLLIEQGADVNAARLPRRYSAHPHARTHNPSSSNAAAVPTIGASGATPLHFAAANGHTHVVRLLLLHGAHADRRDKHGVTPEMVARDSGQEEVAGVLREWVRNKDRDLRERGEGGSSHEGAHTGAVAGSTHLGIGTGAGAGTGTGTGAEAAKGGWGIGTGRDDDDEDARDRKLSGGRLKVKASIDQALNTFKSAASLHHRDAPADAEEVAFPRASAGSGGRRPSFPDYGTGAAAYAHSHARRPRSAGQGAQSFDEAEAVHERERERERERDRERVPSSAQTGGRRLGSKYSLRNIFKKANDSATPSSAEPSYPTTPNLSASPSPGLSANVPLPAVGEGSPLAPRHEAGVAHAMSHRARSSSGSGLPAEDEGIASGNGSAGSARPSILRMHQRTSSGNGGAGSGGSALMGARAIRFDESGGSSPASLVSKARSGVARVVSGLERSLSPGRAVKRCGSVGSLAREEADAGGGVAADGEGEEEEYGEVIRGAGAKARPPAIKPESGANWHRGRGASFASSTCSLSPILSPADAAAHAPSTGFPFSIERPPPLDEGLLTVPPSPFLKDTDAHPPPADEPRGRGDSVSSASTDTTDPHPQLSWSSSTTGTGSSAASSGGTRSTLLAPAPASPGAGARRAHVPAGIDIRSISSHAQAEALVQAAQQSILEMDISGAGAGKEGGGGSGSGAPSPLFGEDELAGRSPLSARLAAYGESLALERRLKRAEEERVAREKEREEHDSPTLMLFTRDQEGQRSPRMGSRRALGVGDAASRPTNPSRARIRQPRRPSTSDSAVSSARPRPHHQTSLSASAVEDPSCLSTHDEIAITHTASTPIPSPSSSTHNLPTITTSAEPEPRFGADVNYPHFPPLTRSITPDPQSPNELALREGVPLSRCSTAPVPDYFDDDLLARGTGRSLQVEPAARHVATASKLTRMGFSAMAQPAAAQDAAKPSRFGIKSFFKSSK